MPRNSDAVKLNVTIATNLQDVGWKEVDNRLIKPLKALTDLKISPKLASDNNFKAAVNSITEDFRKVFSTLNQGVENLSTDQLKQTVRLFDEASKAAVDLKKIAENSIKFDFDSNETIKRSTEEVKQLTAELNELKKAGKERTDLLSNATNFITKDKGVSQFDDLSSITNFDDLQSKYAQIRNEIEELNNRPVNLVTNEDIEQLDLLQQKMAALDNATLKFNAKQKKAENNISLVERDKTLDSIVVKESKLTSEIDDKTKAIEKENAEYKELSLNVKNLFEYFKVFINEMRRGNVELDSVSDKIVEMAGGVEASAEPPTSGMDNLISKIVSAQFVYAQLRKAISDTYQTIKKLDSAFNEIAVVTSYSTKEVWNMYDSFESIAKRVGTTTSDVATIAGEYFKQGKSYQEALILTEAAATSAKIAGISAAESVDYLTSALNGYGLAADKAYEVSDKFALLAAKSATDYSDLATALSKVAAQANNVGVDMDNMLGFIATALENTKEAPENIGTAFKTIFARMSEIKDFGTTLDDMTDSNKIETALNSIGVELFDMTGNMRKLDDVLIDVGTKWKSLTTNQRTYLATTIAGTRQQTRLISIFQDFDRTMELAEASANSLGTTLAQHAKTTQSIDYAVANLTTAWEGLIKSLSNSDAIINIINGLTGLVSILDTGPGRAVIFTTAIGGMFSLLDSGAGKIAELIKNYNKAGGVFKGITALSEVFTAGKLKEIVATKAAIIETDKEALGKTLLGKATLFAASSTKALSTALTGISGAVIIGTITAIAAAIWHLNKRNDKLKESIRDLNAEFYDIDTQRNDINSLVKEYKELYLKVNKTTEELDRMKSIMAQISDLNPEITLFNIDGSVDESALKEYQDSVNEQLAENIENQTEEARRLIENLNGDYTKAWSNADETAKAALKTARVLEMTGKSAKELLSLDSDVLNQYLKIAEQQLKSFNSTKQIIYESSGSTTPTSSAMNAGETHTIQTTTTGISSQDLADFADKNFKGLTELVLDEAFDINNPEIIDKYLKEIKTLWSKILTEFGTDNGEGLEVNETVQALWDSLYNSMPYFDTMELVKKWGLSGEDIVQAMEQGLSIDALNKYFDSILGFTNGNLELSKGISESLKGFLINPNDLDSSKQALETLQDEFSFTALEAHTLVKRIQDDFDSLNNVNLGHVVTSFQNAAKEIKAINEMVEGEINFDTLSNFMQANAQYAEQIAQDIISTGQISKEVATAIMSHNQEVTKQKLLDQQAENEAEIANAEAKLKIVEAALNSEYDANIDYTQAIIGLKQEEITADEAAANAAIQANIQEAKSIQEVNKQLVDKYKLQEMISGNAPKAVNLTEISTPETVRAADIVQNNKEAYDYIRKNNESISEELKSQIESLKASNATIDIILSKLGKKEWTESLMGFGDSAKSSAKEAEEELEEYERRLNSTYVATQRLAAATAKLNLNEAYMELYDLTDGKQWAHAWANQIGLLEEQTKAFEDLIKAQKAEQNQLLATSEVAGVFRVENGRLIPIMEKYNALSDEDAKSADKLAESYNNLSSEIEGNTVSMVQNQSAIKKLYNERRDKTIELQQLLIEAIRAEQKAIFEESKAGLEKEIELLNMRKKAYQDAFAEEDYQNELGSIDEQRQNVMTQLSGLEGTTDLASQQKRQELLKQLEDLNKQYNDRTTEYNREALLQQIDDEVAATEEKIENLEKEYEERINDYEWLEEQINAITQQGGDAVMEYLKTWHEDYINGTTLMKERTAEQWQILVDQVLTEANRSAAGNRDSLNSILADTRSATNSMIDMWNSVAKARAAALAASAPKETVHNGKTELNSTNIYTGTPSKKPGWHKDPDGSLTWTGSGTGHGAVMIPYAEGGEINYTGPAWVDGTKSRPERVLTYKQNEAFMRLVDMIEDSGSIFHNNSSNEGSLSSEINIENIEIKAENLNNNQDFNAAGKTLALAFQKAINSRGIPVNQKK